MSAGEKPCQGFRGMKRSVGKETQSVLPLGRKATTKTTKPKVWLKKGADESWNAGGPWSLSEATLLRSRKGIRSVAG